LGGCWGIIYPEAMDRGDGPERSRGEWKGLKGYDKVREG